ncbi:hypothetical protein ACFC18_40195 [Streptomyces sp. NPDC056121]|uniref:hypothetical protein n=1 Tax=unclassified Streptomyces TaxID=2593676 RepID=UPI002259B563|nr:hypothetical protein [Streptomyces sp. NBC_00401]MCX5083992.1 hypothetical protein [Streptomyces sp. NBC_00401]
MSGIRTTRRHISRLAAGVAMLMLATAGVATAASGTATRPDPNAAPSTRPAAGPEVKSVAAAGSRPVSGKNPTAAPSKRKDAAGFQRVISQKIQLKNTVTDADGDKSTLTFEVWTADAAGKPKTKVKLNDSEFGVIVSPYVASGTLVTVDVPAGRLSLNTNYVFHTSAFDGSLYETTWSPWAPFRPEMPVDLTLPTPDYTAPNPSALDNPPSGLQTKPLGAGATLAGKTKPAVEQCGPKDAEGRQACFGRQLSKADAPKKVAAKMQAAADEIAGIPWCNTDFPSILSTRSAQCDVRSVPVYISMDGVVQATAYFMFVRTLQLDGANSFTEHLLIEPAQQIPLDFAEIDMNLGKHFCQGSCDPIQPDASAWKGKNWWVPGEMHSAEISTPYTWDATTAGQTYLYKPDVQVDGAIMPSDGKIRPFMTGYQWSLDYRGDTAELDQIRCDTTAAGAGTGCVFVNSAPTFELNSKAFPQATAHAWLIQTYNPTHPGSEAERKPLYYMGDESQNGRSRDRICPTGWAKDHGDASALVDATDELNCDEFAFASSYNSGGMTAAEGGLNPALLPGKPTPTGDACLSTYAKKLGAAVHLLSLDGTDPTFTEVCGRSAISGMHNQQSMGGHFGKFMKDMRIMDKDAYWLDTRMTPGITCLNGGSTPVICKLTPTA